MGNSAQEHGAWGGYTEEGRGAGISGKGDVVVANAGSLSDRRTCKYKHKGEQELGLFQAPHEVLVLKAFVKTS